MDFKAASDTIWWDALWKMLRSVGVYPKMTSLIEAMYENVEYAVTINGQLTDWFKVEIGVRLSALTYPVQLVPSVCHG